jgi:Phage capsid protein
MSQQLDAAWIQAFTERVHWLGQQREAKCYPAAVRVEEGVIGKSFNFDRVGPIEMVQITTLYQDTPLVDTPHTRRKANVDDFSVAELIPRMADYKALLNANSIYAKNLAQSRNRKIDRIILAAVPGNSISVAADDTNANVALPAGQIIVDGGTSLTMSKVAQAKAIMDDASIDDDDRYFFYSPQAMRKLLEDTKVSSTDFNTVKALVDGGLPMDQRWYGFFWRQTTLLTKTVNIRRCLAWQKNCVGVAVGKYGTVETSTRADKNNAPQLLLWLGAGATRIEEAGVVAIDCDESVV